MLRRLDVHRDVEAYTPHPFAFDGVLGRISSKFVGESIFGSRKATRTLSIRPLNSTNRCVFDQSGTGIWGYISFSDTAKSCVVLCSSRPH